MIIWRIVRQYPLRFLAFFVFLCIVIGVRIFDVGSWVDVQTLQQYEQQLVAYVRDYYWSSVAIFIGLYALEVSLAMPFSFVLSIAGGFLYGTWPAVLYILVGATTGAVLSCLIVRYLIGYKIQQKYQDALERFNQELDRSGAYYIIILRLIPIVPFFLINILVGFTQLSVITFGVTTAVGMLPGAAIYAAAGDRLREIDKLQDIFTWETAVILGLLVALAAVPVIVRWYYQRPLPKQ